MTNSEAIDILKKRIELSNEMLTKPFFQDAQETIKKTIEAYKMAIKALENDWIPVTETKRLPEEGHDVLITKESLKIKGYEQRVIKAKRSVDPRSGKIEWWSPEFGTLTNNAVLAWMPLPEPWKGEGNGQ